MDYTIPCGPSQVHPDGVCRKKLHGHISNGFMKLAERRQQEAMEEEYQTQMAELEQQKKDLHMQGQLLKVKAGKSRITPIRKPKK